MGVPLFQEKRLVPRKKLTGLLPGRITVKETGEQIDCKPFDISKSGLGIITVSSLDEGSILMLKTHDQEISLQVSWKKPDFGKQDLYRYGLNCDETDLIETFSTTGCLV